MLKIKILIISLLIAQATVWGQVVRTEPAFPAEGDSVTVIFDAAQGSGGLVNYTGDIWAHTGVITDKSTSASDWKYVIAGWSQNTDKAKLRSLGNNLWEFNIRPSIRAFYGVPAGEKILKLAFVFRNSNGSKEGKTSENGDIFVTVYEAGLNLTLTTPDRDFLVIDPGQSISVTAQATAADSIAVFQDLGRLYSVNGLFLNYTLTGAASGFHTVEVIGYGQGNTVRDSFNYLVRGGSLIAELPAGVKDGINYQGDHQATLVLYAPGKEFVFAIGDFTDWKIDPDYQMNRTPDGNRYWITLTGIWTAVLDLKAGEIKFRANDGWDVNYGDDGANGTLEQNGANIPIANDGSYTITLKLGVPDYTYTVVRASYDRRALFFTQDQNLDISNLFAFNDGFAVTKFKNVTSTGTNGSDMTFVDTDFAMFRLADVYLMYAEAVLRGGAGSITKALELVNELRTRAYMDEAGNIEQADLSLEFILDERARELYWEGTRRTDLIRFGKFSGGAYVWEWKGNAAAGAATDSRFDLFPIPATDMGANPNLKQNKGY